MSLLRLTLCLTIALGAAACNRARDVSGRKIFRVSIGSDIRGFDPAFSTETFTHIAVAQVYQGLLQYKYLARPYAIEPLLAAALPKISPDGLTYEFKLRPEIRFHDDPAFHGKPRILSASDVAYSLNRVIDPATASPNRWLFQDCIRDIETPDDQTVVIRLKKPFRQLLHVLATLPTAVVAKEVVERYGAEFLNHAVGTGPFILREWTRGQRIRFEKNPTYWDDRFFSEGTPEDEAGNLLKANGKRLPFIDEVLLSINIESQPAWLNFLKGNLDVGGIPKDAYDIVFDQNKNIRQEIADKRIVVARGDEADVVLFAFNMEDPVLGQNRYLRQAISSAFNREQFIRIFYNDRATEAHTPIPPSILGFDPNLRNPYSYNLSRAQELMKKAREFHRSRNGEKDLPTILHDMSSSTTSRQFAEMIARNLKEIGLTVETRMTTWPQFNEKLAKKQVHFFGSGWNADYPDAENFLQLLYSKNVSPGSNHANFRNAEYDRLYEEMRNLPDSPKRNEVINRMVGIIHEEVPWILIGHRQAYGARHAWVKNFKRNAFFMGLYKYIDLDLEEKKRTLPLLDN